MDIISYLKDLIRIHTEVGIPNLGTFFKKKSPGRYDADLHSFLPPRYDLHFKPEVTEENLLADYIGTQHHLSGESSRYHLDKFVEQLKQDLANKQEVGLNNLGKLISQNGGIHFIPAQDLNLGYKYYGLPAVADEKEQAKLEAIIVENTIEEENPGLLPEEPIYTPSPVTAPEVVPEPNDDPEPTANIAPPVDVSPTVPAAALESNQDFALPEEPAKRGMPAYVKLIIALLLITSVALGMFLLNPDWLNKKEEKAPAPIVAPVSVPREEVIIPADTSGQEDSLANDIDTLATPIAPQPVTYEVIGSSVYGEKEAASFIAAMKKKWGINAKIVSQRPGKKIKISIATYHDEKKARSERTRLEEKINIPGLYIYVNTNKPE